MDENGESLQKLGDDMSHIHFVIDGEVELTGSLGGRVDIIYGGKKRKTFTFKFHKFFGPLIITKGKTTPA